MTANTTRGYPFPQLTDTVDGIADYFQDLAEAVDADMGTQVTAALRHACRVTQANAGAQTGWTTGTYNTLTFTNTEDFDSSLGLHDTVTNPSRITIGKKLGLWLVQGTFAAASNAAATNIRCRVTLNGTAINGALASDPAPSASPLAMLSSPIVPVIATVSTDYVETQGLVAAASGTLGSQINGEARSAMWAVFLGTLG
jgi:hypothetical protein